MPDYNEDFGTRNRVRPAKKKMLPPQYRKSALGGETMLVGQTGEGKQRGTTTTQARQQLGLGTQAMVQPQVFANQFKPIAPEVPRQAGPQKPNVLGSQGAPAFANEFMAPVPLGQLAPPVRNAPSLPFGMNNPWQRSNPWNQASQTPWQTPPNLSPAAGQMRILPADIHQLADQTRIVPHARWEQPGSSGSTPGTRVDWGNLWDVNDIFADILPTTFGGGGYYNPGWGGGSDWWGNPGGGGGGGGKFWPQFISALARWNID